jgi:hypothetical protein
MVLSNVTVISVVVGTSVGSGVDVSGTVENTIGFVVTAAAPVVKFQV